MAGHAPSAFPIWGCRWYQPPVASLGFDSALIHALENPTARMQISRRHRHRTVAAAVTRAGGHLVRAGRARDVARLPEFAQMSPSGGTPAVASSA